jgi:hypothetical protein
VVGAELVEDADDDGAEVVLRAVGLRDRGQQAVEAALRVARVQGGERVGDAGLLRVV